MSSLDIHDEVLKEKRQVIIAYSNSEYFIFPKSELAKHGIISDQSAEGKRAFRIYSPNLKNLNKQVTKTQKWQMSFYYISPSDSEDA